MLTIIHEILPKCKLAELGTQLSKKNIQQGSEQDETFRNKRHNKALAYISSMAQKEMKSVRN